MALRRKDDLPDFRGQKAQASVRFNNPGAMYPGPSSKRFGATHTEIIGGGHKIAVFPDAISGAAAQFDLLSRNYTGMTVGEAINKWSGGNDVSGYLSIIQRETGVKPTDMLTKELMANPRFAIPFAKAMALQERGRPYPISDAHWQQAHSRAFGDQQGSRVAGSVTRETDPFANRQNRLQSYQGSVVTSRPSQPPTNADPEGARLAADSGWRARQAERMERYRQAGLIAGQPASPKEPVQAPTPSRESQNVEQAGPPQSGVAMLAEWLGIRRKPEPPAGVPADLQERMARGAEGWSGSPGMQADRQPGLPESIASQHVVPSYEAPQAPAQSAAGGSPEATGGHHLTPRQLGPRSSSGAFSGVPEWAQRAFLGPDGPRPDQSAGWTLLDPPAEPPTWRDFTGMRDENRRGFNGPVLGPLLGSIFGFSNQ